MGDLEQLAVHAVEEPILRCGRLTARIDSNDKTPITDGEIELYGSPDKRNSALLGRVSVQVKGRKDMRRIKNDSLGWAIDRWSLEFFRNNGGGLYFYVPFTKDEDVRGVFWVALVPAKAAALLEKMAPAQKTLSVKMERMPTEPAAIESMVDYVWRCRKQVTPVAIEDLQPSIKSLSLMLQTPVSTSTPTFLDPGVHDYLVEAQTQSGRRIPISTSLMLTPVSDPQRRDVTITCGEVTFDAPTIERIDDETTQIRLSDGLSIRIQRTEDGLRANFDLTPAGTLYDQLDDATFFLAAASGEPLIVNGKAMDPLPMEEADRSDLIEARDQLQKMVAVLNTLGVPTDLARTLDPTAREQWLLRTLHSALVEGNETGVSSAAALRMNFAIGPYQIVVLALDGADRDHRQIIDPFSVDHLRDLYIWQPPEDSDPATRQRVTLYDALTVDDLGRTLNLRVDSITEAYQNLPDRRHALERATWTALNLLHAFDQAASPLMANHLLQGASNLTTWLARESGGNPVHSINVWQTKYRAGTLTDEDKHQIRQIRRQEQKTGQTNPHHEACYAILLNEPDELALIVAELTAEQDKLLRSWPIWTLATSMTHGTTDGDTSTPQD